MTNQSFKKELDEMIKDIDSIIPDSYKDQSNQNDREYLSNDDIKEKVLELLMLWSEIERILIKSDIEGKFQLFEIVSMIENHYIPQVYFYLYRPIDEPFLKEQDLQQALQIMSGIALNVLEAYKLLLADKDNARGEFLLYHTLGLDFINPDKKVMLDFYIKGAQTAQYAKDQMKKESEDNDGNVH